MVKIKKSCGQGHRDKKERTHMKKRKVVFMELSPDIYREFKAQMVLEGKTIRDTIENFMKEYVRKRNGSKVRDSGVR